MAPFPDVCGSILNETSGEFQALDRNNDGLYDNNLDCHWSIVAGDNQLVETSKHECGHDWICSSKLKCSCYPGNK